MTDDEAFERKIDLAARDVILLAQLRMKGEEDVNGAVLQILSDALALVIVTHTIPSSNQKTAKEAMIKMAGNWAAETVHSIEQQLAK